MKAQLDELRQRPQRHMKVPKELVAAYSALQEAAKDEGGIIPAASACKAVERRLGTYVGTDRAAEDDKLIGCDEETVQFLREFSALLNGGSSAAASEPELLEPANAVLRQPREIRDGDAALDEAGRRARANGAVVARAAAAVAGVRRRVERAAHDAASRQLGAQLGR